MIQILFVCLGNICRSPMAEGIFNARIKDLGLESKIKSASAGTADYHVGELPDERTVRCAAQKNIPILHRARQVRPSDFRDFDFILAMDHDNLSRLKQVRAKTPYLSKELFLMRSFATGEKDLPVPDPYYGGEKEFEEVFHILDDAITGFLDHLKQEYPLVFEK